MAAPATSHAFLELVLKSALVEPNRLDDYLEQQRAAAALPAEPKELASLFVRDGFLTFFQARQLLKGKCRGFTLGKYKILERLGSGGNSNVFLCTHLSMRRRVALKILTVDRAEDPLTLARFYREARAAASADHANIVHAYDNGQEGDLHFLVMEYVDGFSLQEIIQKHGPMDVMRAAHYMRQAAQGLQHLHDTGLIHRDIKPANLLLERRGTLKILDLGLARFFHDHMDLLTQKYDDKSILGTADYLSPEQAINSHDVDIRTDIYSLGGTFYFLLTGRPPFEGKHVTQKLLFHQVKEPTPIRSLRPAVPESLAAVVAKMMTKKREQRYPSPAAVVEALEPWTRIAIPPPPDSEMPQLCRAAMDAGSTDVGSLPSARAGSQTNISLPRARHRQVAAGAPGSRVGAPAAVAQRTKRTGRPPGSGDSVNPTPRGKPTPDKGHRSPKKRTAADTDNSISSSDTHRNLSQHSPRPPLSEEPAGVAPTRLPGERPLTLTGLGMLVAAVSGVALKALFSAAAGFAALLGRARGPRSSEKDG